MGGGGGIVTTGLLWMDQLYIYLECCCWGQIGDSAFKLGYYE